MCTLIASFRPGGPVPLIVAANRDERLARPASPPRLWPGEIPVLAPRDEVAGGTWLGLNARGLFVAITNRAGVPPDERRPSRGQLVMDALRSRDAGELHQRLRELSPHAYNAFHLFYSDGRGAFMTWSDGERVRQEALGAGLHIVTERSLGGDDHARTELIRARWARLARPEAPTFDELAALMSQHNSDPIGSTCVHVPALGYGTRSSTLLELAAPPRPPRLWWAEGPPCTARYVEQSTLMKMLLDAGR